MVKGPNPVQDDDEQGPNPVHSVHSSPIQATSCLWPAVQPSPAAFGQHQCSPCKSCMQLCSVMQTVKEGCGLCSSIADIQGWIDQLQKDAIKIKRINLQLRQDRTMAVKQAQVWKDKAGELTDKNNALEDAHQKRGMSMSSSPFDLPPPKLVRCPPPPPAPCQPRQPHHPPPSWLATNKKAGPSKSIHRRRLATTKRAGPSKSIQRRRLATTKRAGPSKSIQRRQATTKSLASIVARQAGPSMSIHRMAKNLSAKKRGSGTASCKAKQYAVPIGMGEQSFPIGMGEQYAVPKGFFFS